MEQELNLYKTIIFWADKSTVIMKETLLKAGKRASGKLINSIEYKVSLNGYRFSIKWSSQEYGKYIDRGTKASSKNPSPEMVDSVQKWMKTKHVGGKRMVARGRNAPKNLRGRAYGVAKAILAIDHLPVHYTKAAENLDPAKNAPFRHDFNKAIAQDIENAIDNAVKGNKNIKKTKI